MSIRERTLGFGGSGGALAALLLTLAACSSEGSPAAIVDAGVDAVGDASPEPMDAALADASTDADSGHDAAPLGDAGPPPVCNAAVLTTPIAVSEASAATEVELTLGKRELLVLGDSGTNGMGTAIEIGGAGAARAVSLPLDAAASDDLEGIAWLGGKLYTLTSSGAVRRFTPDGAGGLTRDQDAYGLGAVPYVCSDLLSKNCGKNYEGLCLRSNPAGKPCAGYAASKSEGKLYCLTIDGTGHLVASTTVPPIVLGFAADRLSDCAFGTAGGPAADVLIVATNAEGGSQTYRVDEVTGVRATISSPALGNIEAVAVDRDGSIYVFEDSDSGSQSAAAKKTCSGW